MKEYIVHAPNDYPCAVEEYKSFYGEPIEELIRCKDCKYFESFLEDCGFCNNERWSDGWSSPYKLAEGFCDFAERKSDGAKGNNDKR